MNIFVEKQDGHTLKLTNIFMPITAEMGSQWERIRKANNL